ncbi:hypothetical protein A2661_02050 [Candidatus Giovannonibacteria bacterium RIFCSPHIGHO2_01_FULL_45_24]|uniref:DNA polymerase III delta N-terminal domain-containing protein n=1 Tax=Candidatus Giovannonibacteria bacterium RIFCSPLOWO2_01_FULL_46_32 TaxID=1798353 RepID=A0A1F5XHW6_9BACT|nr:MAG: hypothetical protein A2661_02050 [Candidatus Giovannonibacteria bacterium RIFCSPHIGHO2_01_FULL_45_24]OGF87479.1 MAG: hypothetical protein A3B19_02770 [Candidatus Giovannonibacteria bacterium RIFCSPLOWO2_01_FULL_46_32]
MIYFLFGPNSYQALRKINELKSVFYKKPANFLVEEFDGDAELSSEEFRAALGQSSLFSKTRLVIFKNVLESNERIFKILKENGDFLQKSRDIFVFWERETEKSALAFFKKYAERVQEVKKLGAKELDLWLSKKAQGFGLKISKEEREAIIEEAGGGAEWALENELEKKMLAPPPSSTSDAESQKHRMFSRAATTASPFLFVEKLVSAPLARALLALKEAEVSGQDLQRLIYPLLWKFKQKRMADAYFKGIQAESAMRRDPKDAYEILERFILAVKA